MPRRFSPRQIARVLAKYEVVSIPIRISGQMRLEMTAVADAYALFDRMVEREAHGAAVERFPYWAEVWPASLALARHLCHARLPAAGDWARELGAGLGLVGIVLARLGWKVECTDYVQDALAFAAHNARRNGASARHRVSYLDWRQPVGGSCSFMVAADVVYEEKNHVHLERVLHALLAPGGRFVLGDPQRPLARRFVERLVRQGYGHEVETRAETWKGQRYLVDIHSFAKPAAPGGSRAGC